MHFTLNEGCFGVREIILQNVKVLFVLYLLRYLSENVAFLLEIK